MDHKRACELWRWRCHCAEREFHVAASVLRCPGVSPCVENVQFCNIMSVYLAQHQGGFLFLDVAGYAENIVVSGVFGEEYSTDGGNQFNESLGGGQGQCVRAMGPRSAPTGLAVVGTFGLIDPKDGIAVSTDGGVVFTAYDAQLFTDARYGAFPSSTSWYVSAGNWPESNDDNNGKNNDPFSNNDNNVPVDGRPSVIRRTPRFELRLNDNGGYSPYVRLPGRDERVTSNDTIFEAQISVSHDGGSTWKSVFENKGDFYANGIACLSNTDCCFVGEADAGPTPGARIYCTNDGGGSWNRTMFLDGADNSLLDITTTGTAGEYWAVGGTISALSSTATFYHSTDSGASWTLDSSIDGSYASAVDCVDSAHCWATTLQVLLQTSSVASNAAA